jgi:hypothetical protein
MNRRNNIFSAKLITLCLLPSLAFAASGSAITGSVRNQTSGTPAAGEEVILLRLLDGMQEETRTRTDAQGSFTFNPQLPESRYLVRAMHQGVNYDREAVAGRGITIDVYDAAPRVEAMSGKIEIIRIGSAGNSLRVSDMYDIRNDSAPPVTQAGDHTFEFYLPPKATISSILAAGPNSGGVKISATAVAKDPGHYTLNFPLRPGETRFSINYDLAYNGNVVLHPRLLYPVEQLDVMFPPSMAFKSADPAFHPIMTAKEVTVETLNKVAAGPAPAFEITGNGAPPPLSAAHPATEARPQSQLDAELHSLAPAKPSASAGKSADAGTGQPSSLNATSAQAKALLLPVVIGTVLLLVLGVVIWSRRKPAPSIVSRATPATHSSRLVEAVKEELFQLEQKKVRGAISREEYATAKQALDQAVERAVTKAAAQE